MSRGRESALAKHETTERISRLKRKLAEALASGSVIGRDH